MKIMTMRGMLCIACAGAALAVLSSWVVGGARQVAEIVSAASFLVMAIGVLGAMIFYAYGEPPAGRRDR